MKDDIIKKIFMKMLDRFEEKKFYEELPCVETKEHFKEIKDKMINYLNESDDVKDLGEKIYSEIEQEVKTENISENDIDGFVTFRLQNYLDKIFQLAYMIMEQLSQINEEKFFKDVMKELINYSKNVSNYEVLTIKKNNNNDFGSSIIDENNIDLIEDIAQEVACEFKCERDEIEVEDLIISAIIKTTPRKLRIDKKLKDIYSEYFFECLENSYDDIEYI